MIIPAYQEEARVGTVVAGARRYCSHVIVVDDGSTDRTSEEARKAGAEVIRHSVNRGKGAALNTGFQTARERGMEFVITMDADGQHNPDEISRFVETYRRTGCPVIIGNRMDKAKGTMPWVRRWTNLFMSRLLSRRMGQWVPDTQNGFRLYRCDVLPRMPTDAQRFAAESEVLLDLAAAGVRIGTLPTSVIYGAEKSKIHPLRDTYRFFSMLWRHRRKQKNSSQRTQAE